MSDKIEELEKRIEKLESILHDYLDFWVNGVALKPIYAQFIKRLKNNEGTVV